MPIEAWRTCSYLLCLLDKRNLRKDYSSNGCFIFYKHFHGKDNCCLEVFPLNLVSYLGVYGYSNYRPKGKPQNLLQNILQKKRCFCTLSPTTALTQLPACVLSLPTFKYRAWASTALCAGELFTCVHSKPSVGVKQWQMGMQVSVCTSAVYCTSTRQRRVRLTVPR